MLTKVRTLDIKNVAVDIFFSDHNNGFIAELNGDQVSAPSVDELKEKIKRRLTARALRVSIPFVRWEDGKLKRGTVTGIHGSNHNFLIRWEGEKQAQQEWGRDSAYIDPSVEGELELLARKHHDAELALSKFTKQHHIDVKGKVTTALQELSQGDNHANK